jgi:hypothetical protein
MDPSQHKPFPPADVDTPLTDDERVDQAGQGSFPASDPPPWTFGRVRHPESRDPDGGDNRDRARRRRHLDA